MIIKEEHYIKERQIDRESTNEGAIWLKPYIFC